MSEDENAMLLFSSKYVKGSVLNPFHSRYQ